MSMHPPGALGPAAPLAAPPPAKPSRWQMLLAYGVMMGPTVAKVCLLFGGIIAAGILITKVTEAPAYTAAAGGIGTLVGVVSVGALIALGFIVLIVWIMPSMDDDDEDDQPQQAP